MLRKILKEKRQKRIMIRSIKKIIQYISGCILTTLIVCATIIIFIGAYYLFQLNILKNDYANFLGYTIFQVVTGSMSPALEIGDVIVVKTTKEVEEDDIIVFKDDDAFITHRLITAKDDELITRGDANNSKDTPIKKDDVLGKVELIIPKLGIWRKVLIQPDIMVLTVLVIVILGITFVYTSKSEEDSDEKDDK